MERHREQRRYEELLTGIVASTVCNFSMGAPKKPASPADFMPSTTKEKPEKKQRVSRKQIDRNLRIFLMAQTNARKENK